MYVSQSVIIHLVCKCVMFCSIEWTCCFC